ncbi:MAG: TIGR02281 family clan AA aspartic protease [Sphingomicrobium sp.]
MARLYLLVIAIGVVAGLIMPESMGHRSTATPMAAGTQATRIVEVARSEAMSVAPATNIFGGATVLKRGAGGHFFTDATVNGMNVNFLVDTGATGVALTTDDAQRMGLVFLPSEFSVIGSGASGPVRGKLVVLDRVTMGGKTVEQVPGAILENAEMSLLGQSFLARMGKIEIEGNEMVIR